MFISRKTYDELNARHVKISRKLKELEDANKELEFIEKEIMNEVVFEDVNQELNNVSEDELNNIVA